MSTKKEFSKLLGRRIYLNIPKAGETKLFIDDTTKESIKEDIIKKFSKLEIYAVGADIAEPGIVEGEKVLIDISKISPANFIELSPERTVLMISVFDIIHIW